MRQPKWKPWAAALLATGVIAGGAVRASEPARHAFRVGKVVTMNAEDAVINNAVVFVKDGVIERIEKGAKVAIPDGYQAHEFSDCWLVPGLVDAHNHTAGAMGDLHDYVYLTNPGLDTLHTVEPQSSRVKMASSAGVTTVLLIPGSGTNMSGFGTVCKMSGDATEDMVVRTPGSIKIAQAGNPESYWWRVGRTMMNYNTRQTLEKARDYHLAWVEYEEGRTTDPPEFDPFFDGFRGLIGRQYPASVHTQGYQLVMTTVDMLAKKLGIRTVLDHSTFDGWKVAPLVLEAGADLGNVYTINGPRQYQLDRTQRKMHGNAARWWQGGVHNLGLNTDAPVVPQEELSYQAAMACYYGWRPYEALRGITRIPAEALMIDDRVGSIEPGKDADFGIWTGDPVDPRSWCKLTIVNGRVAHDSSKRRRF